MAQQNMPLVGQLSPNSGLLTFAICNGDPNTYCMEPNLYAVGCVLWALSPLISGGSSPHIIRYYANTGTALNPVWTFYNN